MKSFLDFASAKYYAGEPIISDEEFDRLSAEYLAIGTDQKLELEHEYPMWSLQKCYVGESLIEYNQETVTTPKLDGAAVALYYYHGHLLKAITRGNGKKGQNILDKMKTLVPNTIKYAPDNLVVQITGEVVAPVYIENARNYAAGALNLKSIDEFKTREVYFVAYGLSPNAYKTWSEDINLLESLGFVTVLSGNLNFPTDGKVVRVNDNLTFFSMGYTSKHPRGAYALKDKNTGYITKLLDVVWQVGRTGVVSPVAILEPVNIDGANVSKATLHNIRYIEELGLELGCMVEVVRAGEIIPQVISRAD